jgi:hypothetical protein
MFLKDGRLHVYGVSEDGATIFAHYGIKSLWQFPQIDDRTTWSCMQNQTKDLRLDSDPRASLGRWMCYIVVCGKNARGRPQQEMTTHAIFIFLRIVDLHNFFWRLWLGYAVNATVIIPITTNARLVART